jgi:hypothetical protein
MSSHWAHLPCTDKYLSTCSKHVETDFSVQGRWAQWEDIHHWNMLREIYLYRVGELNERTYICDEALILCVVCGAMGNKMRPLKFDNKQYYFRNIFKNIPTNKIFKVSLLAPANVSLSDVRWPLQSVNRCISLHSVHFPFMSIKKVVPYFCVLREGYYVIIWLIVMICVFIKDWKLIYSE